REKIDTRGRVDLKGWTREEIYTEAARALVAAYRARHALGALKLDAVGKYIERGTYPERVRGTVRDLVTYLFVELIADTNGWRPEQSNEIYQLGLESLIAGASGGARSPISTDVSLADPALHPVVRMGALLDDLELWHQGRGAQEAALETRLERS